MVSNPFSHTVELPHGHFLATVRRGLSLPGFFIADVVGKRMHVPAHTHESANIHFVVSGLYRTEASGFRGTCQGGSLVYDPPGTTHRDQLIDGCGRLLSISLSPGRFADLHASGVLPDRPLGLPEREAAFVGTRMLWEANGSDEYSALVLEGLALEALGHLEAPRAETREPAWLSSACEYLHDYCGGKLSIRRVAEVAGVHPVHLARAFRRFRGCTPGEYRRRVRVERAAEKIRAGHGLADVAHACGFADQAQLTKSFRRVLGHTPGMYRRLVRD